MICRCHVPIRRRLKFKQRCGRRTHARTHTCEVLRVGLVDVDPVLPVGDAVQVPGGGEERPVARRRDSAHLVLVLLLGSFPHVDQGVWVQLRETTTTTTTTVLHYRDGF